MASVEAGGSRPGGRETAAIILVFALGCAVRMWAQSGVGLNHFDEGPYVFSALGLSDSSQPHVLFPNQIRFSPPVFFGLVALAYKLAGSASDSVAIAVNVLIGSLTIPLVWFVTRRWFGPVAAVMAAALLALNESHIAISRTVLTDALFAATFLVAIAFVELALTRRTVMHAALAGLAVGLAWNTKYHGWFALVAGAGAWLVVSRREGWRMFRLQALWPLAVTAGVAVLCYLPWMFFIQSQPGGYRGLAAYQRTFLDPDWIANLLTQARMQHYFDGAASRLAPVLALTIGSWVSGTLFGGSVRLAWLIVGVAVVSATAGGTAAVTIMAVAAAALLVRRSDYAAWIVLAWIGLWLVAAPVYHPYARLILPFTLATQIAASSGLASSLTAQSRRLRASLLIPIAAAVSLIGVAYASQPSGPCGIWRPSRSVADAAEAMVPLIPAGERVLVIGEPELGFYLHQAGRPAFERVTAADLASLTRSVYIVTGIYAGRARGLREQLQAMADQLAPLGSFPIRPNDVRLLDDLSPARARMYCATPDTTFDVTLYRFTPKGAY